MSRSYKDAPYSVRMMRKNNFKPPKNWREMWLQVNGEAWRELRDEWYGNDAYYFGSPIPSWFRRDLNRKHRAKCNQLLREGKTEMPRYLRNVRWVYW